MKISVDLSDSEMNEVCRVTGEKKKGPAIRQLLLDALVAKQRAQLAEKFVSGEWGVDLETFEAGQSVDRRGDLGAAGARRK